MSTSLSKHSSSANSCSTICWLRQRNALLPAISLPPEILAMIFEVIRGDYLESEPFKYYRWIPAVTHICTAWRDIALRTPRLWSSALLYPAEWGHEVLRRAKGAPLDVIIHESCFSDGSGDTAQGISLMETALTTPDRVASIYLPLFTNQPNDVSKILSESIGTSHMPLLESICIHSGKTPCHVLDGILMTTGSTPRLQELILRNSILDFTVPRFRHLCLLELEATLNHPSLQIDNLPSFFIALGEMHDLQILKLSSIFPPVSPSEDLDALERMKVNPIVLPALHEIDVFDACVRLFIFECTKAPNITEIDVFLFSCFDLPDAERNVRSVFEFATSASQPDSTPTRYELSVENSSEFPGITYEQVQEKDVVLKHLKINLDVDHDDLFSLLAQDTLVSSFSAPSRDDELSDVPDAFTIYLETLSVAPTLTTLHIPYFDFVSADILRDYTKFPVLADLCLEYPFFGCKSLMKTIPLLVDWLRGREEQGYSRLHRLVIHGQWSYGLKEDLPFIVTLKRLVGSFSTSLLW